MATDEEVVEQFVLRGVCGECGNHSMARESGGIHTCQSCGWKWKKKK